MKPINICDFCIVVEERECGEKIRDATKLFITNIKKMLGVTNSVFDATFIVRKCKYFRG